MHYFGLSTRSPPPKHVGHRFFHLTAKGFPHHGQITARGQGLLLDYFYNRGLRVVALGELFSSLVAPCGQRASVKDVYQNHQTVISNLERGHHARGKQTWWSYKTFRRKKITRLTYNCAHLRSTKESLTDSVKNLFSRKKFCVKICWMNIF